MRSLVLTRHQKQINALSQEKLHLSDGEPLGEEKLVREQINNVRFTREGVIIPPYPGE